MGEETGCWVAPHYGLFRLTCRQCGNEKRNFFQPSWEDREDLSSVLWLECVICHYRFRKYPRYDNVWDTQGRI